MNVRNMRRFVFVAGLILAASSLAHAGSAVKIFVDSTGVYEVTFEQLAAAAGEDWAGLDSSDLSLSVAGRPVPIWVADGGDGRWGPGDRVVFVGEHLAGEHSFHNEYTNLNVYVLQRGHTESVRMEPGGEVVAGSGCPGERPSLMRTQHLELDRLRVRFPSSETAESEIWFWNKSTQIDGEPFTVDLGLPDLDLDSLRPTTVRVHLKGWSSLPRPLADEALDHRVELRLNGETRGSGEWDNNPEGHTIELELPPSTPLNAGRNALTVTVPKRRIGEDERPQVDVVLVNWIEVTYPRTAYFGDGQQRVSLSATREDGCLELHGDPGRDLHVFESAGRHLPAGPAQEAGGIYAARSDRRWERDSEIHVVPDGDYRIPVAIEPDRPSDLSATDQQVDYIVIAHPTLLDSIQPLVEFHRGRGLAVKVVDTRDVYDEFHGGVVHPRAIRDFIDFAYHEWQPPAPRFVLLVGDASWDMHNLHAEDENYADWTFQPRHRVRFIKNKSTSYDEAAGLNHRNLIPSWTYLTYQGHAATDNRFVTVDGDDDVPDPAIGRMPVVQPAEVDAIVNKTIRYASQERAGTWRRRVLWITNEQPYSQKRTDHLAASLTDRGFTAQKVYPEEQERSNEHHRATLRKAFDEGQLLVHFFGHGGRYIWRTGPPDLKKNHDLFTLDDLDLLTPSDQLPIVLSMTCYSAPFDHPTADSIGEKFLRLDGKGAVGVIAATWRNSPSTEMSELLLAEFTKPGTVGEAMMRAKRGSVHADFLNQYNLLGDPAVPIALPQLEVALELADGEPPVILGTVATAGVDGRLIVEWLNADGSTLHRQDESLADSRFTTAFAGELGMLADVETVRVYVRDDAATRDGIAALRIRALPEPAPTRKARAAAATPSDGR